jgi:RNA polymerase sigma-70 factor (ECF subfamily)
MARVADADADAFEVLYERHARAVHSYALARLGGTGQAEEVCQEAFLALWRHAARFDPRRGGVRAWLIGIARHMVVDRQRAEGRRGRAEGAAQAIAALDPPGDPVAPVAARRVDAARARRALAVLPPEQREVLLLAHAGGLSQREIAEVTGQPLGTVKGRSRLGLERLRGALGGPEPSPDGGGGGEATPGGRRAGRPRPQPASRR